MLTESPKRSRHRDSIAYEKVKRQLQYIKDIKSQMEYINSSLRNTEEEDTRLLEILTYLLERS